MNSPLKLYASLTLASWFYMPRPAWACDGTFASKPVLEQQTYNVPEWNALQSKLNKVDNNPQHWLHILTAASHTWERHTELIRYLATLVRVQDDIKRKLSADMVEAFGSLNANWFFLTAKAPMSAFFALLSLVRNFGAAYHSIEIYAA